MVGVQLISTGSDGKDGRFEDVGCVADQYWQ